MEMKILSFLAIVVLVCLQLFSFYIHDVKAIDFRGQGIRDALMDFNLLNAIKDDDDGIDFVDGTDRFIAYDFKSNADTKSPYRLVLPEKLNEFAIIVLFKPNTPSGGYIFSVVNPLDTIVQLGLHISPKIKDKWNITLLYTDASIHMVSRKLYTIEVPYTKKWTQLSFSVLTNKVTFFYNCVEMEVQNVKREPAELVFDSASTLYLAQAGSIIKGHFEGIIQKLNIYGNPDALPVFCNKTDLPDSGSSSQPAAAINEINDDLGSGDIDFDFDATTDDEYDPSGGLHPPPLPPPPDRGYHRGLKGDKGDRGLKGPPGDNIRGPPGPPGPPGPKGDPGPYPPYIDVGGPGDLMSSGKCTCNATDILDVLKNNDIFKEELRGPQGIQGKEGKTGAPGLTGATGVPGERGAPGLKGDRGDRGDPGAPGPEGIQGQKGESGVDGIPGIQGPSGPPGPPGLPENYDESLMLNSMTNMRGSTPGPKGETGDKGDIGRTGDRGQIGPKGDRGDPGMTGSKGERGHPGTHGLPGLKGEPGSPGLPGLGGPPGANGNKGDRGLPGEIGPSGPAGPPGTVIYTDPRTNTTECQCQAGPPGPPGARGQTGFDGEVGPAGPAGPIGPTGLTGLSGQKGDKGDKGPRGLGGAKGDRGPEGPPGQAVFVTDGPVNGTKGDKGDKGMRGRRGKPGSSGPTGPPGKPGPSGDVGSGRPGIPGPKGDIGQKGQKGDIGGKEGPKGDKGTDGRDGLPGPPGLPAASTDNLQYVPLPGPPGPPGPPGLSITGPKGEPGMEARIPYYGDTSFYGKPGGRSALDEIKAIRELQNLKDLPETTIGPPGPPGPPGTSNRQDDVPYSSSNMKIVPGAVTFQNTEAMTKMSSLSPVGTIAYIIEEEALLVRVNKGWQYIALGSLLPIATPAPPTTIAPPPRPDLQSSNLLNNIPQPVEGPNFTMSPEYETWYPRMLRMAALNEPFYGDLQGIRGADFACYRQARRAGLLGTFKAFLSSRVQNLDSIVRTSDHELPVVNTRGDVLFNSWKGIFNGQGGFFSQAPRIYSFSGKNILTDILWSQKIVWHGSMPNGERAMDTYCDAWHSSSPNKVGLASSLLGNKLLDQERYSCDNRFVVLCIEALSQDRRRKRDLKDINDDEFTTPEEYAKHLNNILI